jgi:hypothetical protein
VLDVLKEALELKGIDNDEAAAIIGRSKKTFLKSLKGERNFYVHEIFRLLAVLEEKGCTLTLEELMDRESALAN